MKYYVINALKLSELIELVNDNMKNGWKPIGGVAVHHNTHYYQAMVRAD